MKVFQEVLLKNCVIIVHLSILALSLEPNVTFDYCSITCHGKKHTMCEYVEGGGLECETLQRGISKGQKEVLVDIHNTLRQQVAMGKGDNGEPLAANMLAMVWDDEAEMIAQRWADQCTLGDTNDVCRPLKDKTQGGQNIAVTDKNENFDLFQFQKQTVLNWFKNNSSLFDPKSIGSYKLDPHTCSYTNIIWALSYDFGCGFVHGKLDGKELFRLVCNYYPAGNIVGQSVYLEGKPCSKCPFGKCSSRWPALCAAPSQHVWNRGDAKDNATHRTSDLLLLCCVIAFDVLCIISRKLWSRFKTE